MSNIKYRGKAWAWETTSPNIIRRIIIYPSLSRSEMERSRAYTVLGHGPVKLRRIQQYSFK